MGTIGARSIRIGKKIPVLPLGGPKGGDGGQSEPCTTASHMVTLLDDSDTP